MDKTATDRMVMKQIIFLLVVVLALLLVLGLLISRAANAGESHELNPDWTLQERDERDRALREAAERRYLKDRDESRLRREYGNYAVAAGVTLEGDLVVTRGAVTIAGKVNGTVLVIRGDALIDSTGEVVGDVVSVGGRIDRRTNSRVFGDMVETSPRYLIDETDEAPRARPDEENRWNHNRKRREWQTWDENWGDQFDFKISYNRVEALFLGGELPRTYNRRDIANIDFFGFGGYGFKSKRWQYEAGAEFYVGREFRFVLGGEAHDRTASQDEWIIPELENSLAASLINEDFRDYYRRDGFSFFATQYFGKPMKVTGAYRYDNHSNMPNKTDWSLFVNDKKFRPNPVVDEGKMISYAGQLVYDNRDHEDQPHRGWLISIDAETSQPDFDSEFDFERFIVDIRRYQPLGYGRNFDIRLRAGTGRGVLPSQYLFDLGGISTLRGFRFKEFTGDRMVLGNVEYRLSSGSSRLHHIPIISEFNLILFADTGLAWFAEDNSAADKSFDSLTWSKLKTNVGVALTDRDGKTRLNFAKRTDVGGKDVVITFRLNRDF